MEKELEGGECVVERYSRISEKSFITLEEAVTLSKALARRASNLSPKPDVVVGVAVGGLLVGKVIADEMGLPYEVVRVQRKLTQWKRKIASHPVLRDALASWYNNDRWNWILKKLLGRATRLQRGIVCSAPGPLTERTVLLVDDCVETGQTLRLVRSQLEARGAVAIHVVVLSWSRRMDSGGSSEFQPDIFLNRVIQHYPWSQNSPEWSKFVERVKVDGMGEWL